MSTLRLLTPHADGVTGTAPPPLVVDAKALAAMLGLSVRTVRKMDAAGKLPRPLRFGHAVRWRLQEIQDWLGACAPDRNTWDRLRIRMEG